MSTPQEKPEYVLFYSMDAAVKCPFTFSSDSRILKEFCGRYFRADIVKLFEFKFFEILYLHNFITYST